MSNLPDELRDRIDATIPPLVPVSAPERIAVLDAPDYPNVGDPLILLGQLAFLRRAFPRAKIVIASRRTYADSVAPAIEEADCLFLTGGGNFGDIWPGHHDFRLKLIARFRDKPIIHFPQSFHFAGDGSLTETQRVLGVAQNLTILARDAKGLDFARRHFPCRSELCPDMAFALGRLAAPEPEMDFACLLRTDKEILADKSAEIEDALSNSGATYAIADWLENRPGLEKIHGATRLLVRMGMPPEWLATHGLPIFEAYANSRLKFGVHLLGRGRTVVTDRLHGAILATLLGRPRYIFDSLDGKIRAFYDTWLRGETDAVFFGDVDELRHKLQRSEAA
ncbi:polysaccharide pyruvyl transferase family protein [Aurantimonas endophytica]|uniref:Pyruvyl transferase EpsO n=1 Tax=Aurantimonas endophytica TaxID=1522175 RepID=A0A7W6HGH1_9HYPH|nr:polysaccharide pyruvyl transferase family protein [Aurantimonas endophytica]MBB4004799.1 pyruvyl transferase EpsO [Aurantimonas endophytica]MCO6405609.1 hypothetical protein [Aurantimonas endophytica]